MSERHRNCRGYFDRYPNEGKSYRSMVKRCTQKNDKTYKRYGAKGITICNRWLEKPYGFKNFIEDMGPKPEGTSLDRIDNNKGYSPDNCRWATYSQQSYNRKDWSGHRGIQKVTFYKGKFGPYTYWRARICWRGKTRLKSFKTEEEAIAQRKKWEKEIPQE